MDLLILARCLRDEAVVWAKQQTGKEPNLQDIALMGAPRNGAEAFAVAFRFSVENSAWGVNEYTVTISETKK
ncbi:MAG TPA: hypothetical protein VEP90_27395 [Methylomirabilota bacterium]|nr:hypothetical protein [Methylomirabilota bacterium]